MKEKNKFIVWLKSLPIGLTGLVAFIGIMLLLTSIFNWFWTGLGTDPTRTFYAPFTNKFIDFKEYAALYIPLISFGATLFAGFVVFLVFNDWKEQHNKTVISTEAKELWHKFKSLEKKTHALEEIYLRSRQIQELVYFKGVPDLDKETSDLINEYDKSYPELNYFTELANDTNNNVHQNYYGAIKAYREYIETIERNTTIGEIYTIQDELRTNLIKENQNIRKYLSGFILIK